MKVIIVEVTRAANSFGRTHLDKIREAYDGIADIVRKAQQEGAFKTDVTPQFAALAFYGAIEQVLTGWIFDLLPPARTSTSRPRRSWSRRSAAASTQSARPLARFRARWTTTSSSAWPGPACSPASARWPASPTDPRRGDGLTAGSSGKNRPNER